MQISVHSLGSLRLLRLFTLVIPAMIPAVASAQVSFTEITTTSGLGDYPMPNRGFGSGVAAADFDDDGDIDLFVSTADESPHLLYRNLGDGTFEEIAAAVGMAETEAGRSALWFDYDADGRLDLLINSDCYMKADLCSTMSSFLRLYRQTEDGMFVQTTATAGLTDQSRSFEEHRSGIAAADVNGDGYLDFATGFWVGDAQSTMPRGSMDLYLNQRDGTFVEISAAAGIDDAVLGYHQPIMLDMNGDDLIDLFSSVDFAENRLWIHQGSTDGQPSFLDLASTSSCDNAMNDMGVAQGDFDDDGDPDLYITNIFRNGFHNVFERNDSAGGSPACVEISHDAGVEEGGWGWGTTFFDVDNDGFLDLAETNGWRNNGWESPPRLFVRDPGLPITFTDRALEAGLTNDSWGSTLLAGDFDRDGDLDLLESRQIDDGRLQGSLSLYRNDLDPAAGDRRFLTVRPRMASRNKRAIGAKITVEAGGRTMTRWITAGTSYLGQEPAEAFFGLGAAVIADRVTVHWPHGEWAGEITILSDVTADQVLTVLHEGIFADGFESGDPSAW